MTSIYVSFDYSLFNRIFPFHIQLNRKMEIVSLGRSMEKLCSLDKDINFDTYFKIARPQCDICRFETFLELTGQLVIIELIDGLNVTMRGQLEYLPENDCILFIGSPWLSTIDHLAKYKLSLTDFALHDPSIDMLHLLRTREIAHDDVKELLRIVNTQRDELKRISLIASANENGVIFTERCGKIFWINEGFTRLTGYSTELALGKTPVELCKGELTDRNTLREMADLFNRGLNFEVELVFYRKNGSYFWGRVKGQSVLNESGTVVQYFSIIEDITAEKNSNNLIKQQEEKYQRIIKNMNLGMVEVDLNNRIQYVNQSFCNMSGYGQHELIGQQPDGLFVREQFNDLMEKIQKSRTKGESDAYEILVLLKNGEKRWWLISGAPLYNHQGEITGSIGIYLDITHQKLLQQQLEAAKKEAENSANAKQTFLANMSHEIRTPLNAIHGMSRQLQKTKLTSQQRMFLNIIGDASENLLVIINDILDFSKIEAGMITLEDISFNMDDLICNSIHILKYKAEEKGLSLVSSVSKKIAPILTGDPYRIKQIIMNLLSNSIKFTDHGKVEILCYVHKTTEYEQHIELVVRDTGKGMDNSFLKDLFNKFSQEDESIVRSYGGTGLGMSIVKQLVELMNGSINVKSRKGKGTEISILLPFKISREKCLPLKDKNDFDRDILAGKNILLVEDNEINRFVAVTILSEYGAEITEAVNGMKGIEMLQKKVFDIVLMDMQMPVMDGIEATKIIRRSINSTLPIIALTANAVKGEMEKCIQAGMNDYISKPFEEEDLVRLIAKWVKRF